MGFSNFVAEQKEAFIKTLDRQSMPAHVERYGPQALAEWMWTAFQEWFQEHREELLIKEYARRGWAKKMLAPDEQGQLVETYRVSVEAKKQIDAWLADEVV